MSSIVLGVGTGVPDRAPDDLLDSRRHRRRIGGRLHGKSSPTVEVVGHRSIDVQRRILCQADRADVIDDADDLEQR